MTATTLLHIPATYRLNVLHEVKGIKFYAELAYDTPAEVTAAFSKLDEAGMEVSLEDAEITLDLSRKDVDGKYMGCYQLDDESNQLLAVICKELVVDAQSFLNERMGSYDPLNNRITPADLGNIFPDGTMRIFWHEENSRYSFDTALTTLQSAIGFLIQLEAMPLFQATPEEYEDSVYTGILRRRTAALFAAGFWPEEDEKEPLPDLDVTLVNILLDKYSTPESDAYKEIVAATDTE